MTKEDKIEVLKIIELATRRCSTFHSSLESLSIELSRVISIMALSEKEED